MAQTLVSVRDLSVRYRSRDEAAYALDQVSFDMERGRVYALVGESGSGKITIGMSLLNLLPDEADILGGEVYFGDRDILRMTEPDLREIRGRRITMIFQDPVAGLNPVIPIGDQVGEVLTTHLGWNKREAKAAAVDILAQVGLPDPKRVAKSYPFQLSGGMCQRVMIGIATALRPDLIVADEPTAALDVTIQAQILDLMREIQETLGQAISLITHDMGVVAENADRVVVMYAGRMVEEAPVDELFDTPAHPYTLGLLGAIPNLEEAAREDTGRARLNEIKGMVPSLANLPRGCTFAPRCGFATEECRASYPPLRELRPSHWVACFQAEALLGDAS